jgi:pSer/pThr/pTyr-binding forkhead associated (FHA) protein
MSKQLFPVSLTVQIGPQPGQTFAIREGANSIGRDQSNDICLPEQSVSRSHARIVVQPDGVWVEDLGSRNGTFVNGQRITAPTRLQPGDTLQIGTTVTLTASLQAAPAQAPRPDATLVPGATAPGPAVAPLGLVVQHGPQPGQVFPLASGPQTIGRAPGNQITIPESTISKQHAQVTVQSTGVWIQDLGSANGTFVNGQRITAPTRLTPSDVVQVGTTVTLGLQALQPGGAPISTAVRPPAGMAAPRPSKWVGLGIIAGAALLLILAGAAAAAWFFLQRPETPPPLPGPSVLVYEPAPDANAIVNEPLLIYASARDDEQQVGQAELWVDGELVEAQSSDLPDGLNPFTFAPTWTPSTAGQHTFFVRAYSTDGRPGQSDLIGINALEPGSGNEELAYVTQEGDTLETIADKAEVSTEEIIALNPALEEVVTTGGAPPPPVTTTTQVPQPSGKPTAQAPLPPGTIIILPPRSNTANIPIRQPRPPTRPPQPPGRPGAQGKPPDPPPPPCSSLFAPKQQEFFAEITQLTASGPGGTISLADVECYAVIGGSAPLWKSNMSGDTKFPFTAPPARPPLPVNISCLEKGQSGIPPKIPHYLGYIISTVDSLPNRGAGGQFIQQGQHTSVGGKPGYSFKIDYLVCSAPGPCSTKVLGGGGGKPGNFVGINLDGGFRGPTLSWQWQPTPAGVGQQICFEVHERAYKQGGPYFDKRVSTIPPVSVNDLGLINQLAPARNLAKGLGCDMLADYYVLAVGPDGPIEQSQTRPSPPVQGPPCARTATVTFDKVKVRSSPGSPLEMYRIWLIVNTEPIRSWRGAPIVAKPVYNFSQFFPPDNNVFNVRFGSREGLNITAVLFKFDNGWQTWCRGSLSLSNAEVQSLVNRGPTGRTLNPVVQGCDVDVSIQVP